MATHPCARTNLISSHEPSFLRLSAEIRNKIYGYLCCSADPIRLYFYQDDWSNTTKPVVPFASSTTIPTAFFSTCRQVNTEASSTFYSRNTFLLNRQTDFAFFIQPCFIGTLLKFIDIVGSRASLVRHVAFDRLVPCSSACHHTYTDAENTLFDPVTDVIEVTAFLRQAWERDLNFQLHSVNVGNTEEGAHRGIRSPNLAHASTIMAIVQSLLDGELDLKGYHELLHGVAVKLDGSGGLICCSSALSGKTIIEFIAWDGGTRLELAPQAPGTLLKQPCSLQSDRN